MAYVTDADIEIEFEDVIEYIKNDASPKELLEIQAYLESDKLKYNPRYSKVTELLNKIHSVYDLNKLEQIVTIWDKLTPEDLEKLN